MVSVSGFEARRPESKARQVNLVYKMINLSLVAAAETVASQMKKVAVRNNEAARVRLERTLTRSSRHDVEP